MHRDRPSLGPSRKNIAAGQGVAIVEPDQGCRQQQIPSIRAGPAEQRQAGGQARVDDHLEGSLESEPITPDEEPEGALATLQPGMRSIEVLQMSRAH
ncbi:MAG: hypothetical protein AAFU79_29375, partial [Myxococcota bacterium]